MNTKPAVADDEIKNLMNNLILTLDASEITSWKLARLLSNKTQAYLARRLQSQANQLHTMCNTRKEELDELDS